MLCAVSCLSWALLASSAAGQNPFGEPSSDSPFGTTTPAAGGDSTSPFGSFGAPADAGPAAAVASDSQLDSLKGDPNPVVRLLRESPPNSPSEMAQGLTWMVRFKRWDEVKRLLDGIAAKNWSLAELSELAKASDPALWLRLSTGQAEFSEAQQALIASVLAAPAKLASDAAWLDSWIDKLAEPQPGQRRLAQLRLQDGGRAAIERLIERLLAGDAKVDKGMLAGTVAEFDVDGIGALKAACLVKDAERAGRVFLGIAEIPGNKFAAELAGGLMSSQLSAQTKTELASVVQRRFDKVPTLEAIQAYLTKQFQTQLAEYQLARTELDNTNYVVWRQSADGRSVQAIDAQNKDRQLEALAQLAAHRMNLTSAAGSELVDCGAIVLQRAYQAQPGLTMSQDGGALIANFNQTESRDPSYWISVFERASELQMHGGAVRAIQMMVASSAGPASMPLEFLTRLLGDSRPSIRFLALEAIERVDPKQSFGGAEKALKVALEMSWMGNGPQALVVGINSQLRKEAEEQLIGQVNAQVTTADSARAALLALDSPTPIELVVIVDRVADQSIYELLQRLRGSARGQSLPIAVLTDELYPHEHRLIKETPGIVGSNLSRSPGHMRHVVAQLENRLDTQPFTPEDRTRLAMAGSKFLSRIAKDPATYAFYPLSLWQDELGTSMDGLDWEAKLSLLSSVGTSDNQRRLVSLASASARTAPQRFEAAKAFVKSIQRFGLNFQRDEVLKIYDVYNVLGPNDPATAQSLGLVLDAIEALSSDARSSEGL